MSNNVKVVFVDGKEHQIDMDLVLRKLQEKKDAEKAALVAEQKQEAVRKLTELLEKVKPSNVHPEFGVTFIDGPEPDGDEEPGFDWEDPCVTCWSYTCEGCESHQYSREIAHEHPGYTAPTIEAYEPNDRTEAVQEEVKPRYVVEFKIEFDEYEDFQDRYAIADAVDEVFDLACDEYECLRGDGECDIVRILDYRITADEITQKIGPERVRLIELFELTVTELKEKPTLFVGFRKK